MVDIPITGFGTKLLADGKGKDKIPINYSPYLRNARVLDGTITKRRGFVTRIESAIGTNIKGIVNNSNNNSIYAITNSKFYEVNLTNQTLDVIGDLANDNINNFITYGKYTIILTGTSKPYVYDGTTLSLLTTECPDVNPIIGDKFAGFTCIAGNTDDTRNILYISVPITTALQSNCYDWTSGTSETITFSSDIVGIRGTNNYLYIFTKDGVEYISRSNIDTNGGVASLFAIPIGDPGRLASHRSIVSAGDKIFYVTEDAQVRTINYVEGTIDNTIGQLSDQPIIGIRDFMDDLNSDLSESFGYLNTRENVIHFHLKTADSTVNNIVLIYDIINQTFGVDNNKYYSCIAGYNSLYYAGSSLNSNIMQDDVSSDDDGDGVPFQYNTKDFLLGSTREKERKGFIVSGSLNSITDINIEILVDQQTENNLTINIDDVEGLSGIGIGGSSIGGQPIGGEYGIGGLEVYDFDRYCDKGNLYQSGKRCQLIFTENTAGSEFYLENLTMIADAKGSFDLSDKF